MTTIASYNIFHEAYAERHDVGRPYGTPIRWEDRQPHILFTISLVKPPILLLQEADVTRLPGIIKEDQKLIFAQHKGKFDGLAIIIDTKKFNLLKTKTHYGENDLATLIVQLQDRTTGKIIRVANVHLEGGMNRDPGNKQLSSALDRIEELEKDSPSDGVIVAGVFSEDAQGPRSSALTAAGFTPNDPEEPPYDPDDSIPVKIDHMFMRLKGAYSMVRSGAFQCLKISDHHFVYAQLSCCPQETPRNLPLDPKAKQCSIS